MDRLRNWINGATFERIMLTIILANAVVIGLETYPEVMQQWGDTLHLLD
ncbi:MAG: ion transporter, partial [Candidatus Hydrogenedentes bacterium]|nr:ion transporter [Candidatus Hydrogenedentota bacterium]